jgi:hypothetical protein
MWTREKIVELLNSNPRAVERGIVRLYQRQTEDEQAGGLTRHLNGRGFNATDAKLGTYLAKWILDKKSLDKAWLDRARTMCVRYAGQLTEMANETKK